MLFRKGYSSIFHSISLLYMYTLIWAGLKQLNKNISKRPPILIFRIFFRKTLLEQLYEQHPTCKDILKNYLDHLRCRNERQPILCTRNACFLSSMVSLARLSPAPDLVRLTPILSPPPSSLACVHAPPNVGNGQPGPASLQEHKPPHLTISVAALWAAYVPHLHSAMQHALSRTRAFP